MIKPQPYALPLLGHYPRLRGRIHTFMWELFQECGDIAFFDALGYHSCLISHPDLIEQVLVKHHHHMIKPWDVRELKVALGEGLLTNEGKFWKQQRQMIQPAFHNSRIRSYGQSMVDHTQKLIDTLPFDQPVDMHQAFMNLTLDIVADTLFGVSVAEDAKKVGLALEVLTQEFEALMNGIVPLPLWVPTPAARRVRKAIALLDEVVYGLIGKRQQHPPADDLLSWLMESGAQNQAAMSTQQLRDELVTLLLAGHETTAIGLSWTLYLLSEHPRVEALLKRELNSVLKGRPPEAEDAKMLPYLQAVIKESLRLYPPAWSFGRETTEDFELGGYPLPKGTQIWACPWIVQQDGRFFKEPQRFWPERWLQPEIKSLPRYAYLPFGGGPRVCVGLNFANMELALVLATLYQHLHFERVKAHPIELQASITLRPKYGIQMIPRAESFS